MPASKLLFQFVRPYPLQIVLSIGMGFSGAVFNGIGTTLIVPAVFQLLGNDRFSHGGSMPPLLQHLMRPLGGMTDSSRAIAMLVLIVLAIVLKNLANYASVLASESLSRALTRDLRKAGVDLLMDVDLAYHHQMRTGDIIQRLNDQVGRTVGSISTVISLVRITMNMAFFVLVLLVLSWPLTLVATVLMSIVLLANRYIINRAKHYGRLLAEVSRDYSVRVLETLNGIRLVKATASEQREKTRLLELINAREKAAYDSQMNAAIVAPLNEVLSILALVGIVFISQFFLNQGALGSVTDLLTFLYVLSRMIPFTGQLNASRSRLANGTASVEFVYDFLRRDNKTFMPPGSRPYGVLQQGIHFQQLRFAYPGSDRLALADIDLYLPKGQTLALVGASGAGKSTLADLLPRFYDPDAGRITIDGVDLRDLDIGSLRRRMGIVSQDTFLFNASVRDNIAYANPDATDEAIHRAIQRANAQEFIERLPQGLETPIGDRGVLLSGGQRQRLAIARALVQDPDILILDEATSALDTVSERIVQEALDELSRRRTTLVIAHRLSTIRNADQIAVLDSGRVVEIGTHAQLLERQGKYAALYTMQFAKASLTSLTQQAHHPLVDYSHDIRTSLTTMMGVLNLMADGLAETPEERMELAQEGYQAALSLLRVIELSEHPRALPPAPDPALVDSPLTSLNGHGAPLPHTSQPG